MIEEHISWMKDFPRTGGVGLGGDRVVVVVVVVVGGLPST